MQLFLPFSISFLVLSVVLAQVLFNVSRFLKLYVNYFSEFWIVSRFNLYAIADINPTELVNEFTTEDDRWTIETCLVVVHFLKMDKLLNTRINASMHACMHSFLMPSFYYFVSFIIEKNFLIACGTKTFFHPAVNGAIL